MLKTYPPVDDASADKVLSAEAYIKSPAVNEVNPVPPLLICNVPVVSDNAMASAEVAISSQLEPL